MQTAEKNMATPLTELTATQIVDAIGRDGLAHQHAARPKRRALKERFTTSGAYVVGSTPEELTDHVKKEIMTWAKVIKAAGIKLE